MKILFLARATLYSVYGGDTVQVDATAKYLRRLGIEVDVRLANQTIDYSGYDLLHIFNAIRPADVLTHIAKSGKPYVLSTIYVDFSDYQRAHATGLVSLLSRHLSPDNMEYLKTIARWIKNGEKIQSNNYLLHGHRKAVQELAKNASYLLPNSENEYRRFSENYGIAAPYRVIYNGIDGDVFSAATSFYETRDPKEVICVARIEGKKNQLNLIKALNNTDFKLRLIGKPAPNHSKYFDECLRIAAPNVSFEGFVPQENLLPYYQKAKVHVLASWNETCGLSSLEAANAGCNIVITDKGDTVEYFGEDAAYCDPGNPESIYNAVVRAADAPPPVLLQHKINTTYNWGEAAKQTAHVYERVLRKVNASIKPFKQEMKQIAS